MRWRACDSGLKPANLHFLPIQTQPKPLHNLQHYHTGHDLRQGGNLLRRLPINGRYDFPTLFEPLLLDLINHIRFCWYFWRWDEGSFVGLVELSSLVDLVLFWLLQVLLVVFVDQEGGGQGGGGVFDGKWTWSAGCWGGLLNGMGWSALVGYGLDYLGSEWMAILELTLIMLCYLKRWIGLSFRHLCWYFRVQSTLQTNLLIPLDWSIPLIPLTPLTTFHISTTLVPSNIFLTTTIVTITLEKEIKLWPDFCWAWPIFGNEILGPGLQLGEVVPPLGAYSKRGVFQKLVGFGVQRLSDWWGGGVVGWWGDWGEPLHLLGVVGESLWELGEVGPFRLGLGSWL